MSVSDKRLARERLHMLVIEDDHANSMSRQSLLNAYRLKMELQSQEEEHRDTTTHCLIRTMDPIIIPPARKFEHRPGARITPNTYKHPLSVS